MKSVMNYEMVENKEINIIDFFKFVMLSGFGLAMFIFPIKWNDSFSTGINIFTEIIEKVMGDASPWIVLIIMCSSTFGTLITILLKPKFIMKNKGLKELFDSSPLYIITKIVALTITVMVVFNVGPEALRSKDVGANMLDLSYSLVAIAISLSFILPFLTDCGVMEFFGVLLKPVARPLFKVPGRASVDLITSWLGSSNTAVILSKEQYVGGYYSKREAASIMSNFSLVSIPFCIVVAESLDLSDKFPLLYGTVTILGILLAAIGVRIPPISRIPNTYYEKTGKTINEEAPDNESLIYWAIKKSCKKVADFNIGFFIRNGAKITLDILIDLIPVVIAWGSIGLILVNYTPIFKVVSYPIGTVLSMLGVEDAFKIAPATLVGFIDMFIPALIVGTDVAVKSRFIIAALSLIQIIYMTEVGIIILKSDVGIDLKRLVAIFLERTIISIPILIIISKFI